MTDPVSSRAMLLPALVDRLRRLSDSEGDLMSESGELELRAIVVALEAVPTENKTTTAPVPKLERLPGLKPHEFLLFCSYCGDDNPEGCTDARPCNDCLAMCNIFGEDGKFIREMGPPLTEHPNLAPSEAQKEKAFYSLYPALQGLTDDEWAELLLFLSPEQRATLRRVIVGEPLTDQKIPVPAGVYYKPEEGNFYGANRAGMGLNFYNQWKARRDEFPQSYEELEQIMKSPENGEKP